MVSNSVAQQPNIIPDSIASRQRILLFLRKADPFLICLVADGLEAIDLSPMYRCLSDCAVMDKLENIRRGDYRLPYSNLSRPWSAEDESPQWARTIHSNAITPLLTRAQTASHRVRPTAVGSFTSRIANPDCLNPFSDRGNRPPALVMRNADLRWPLFRGDCAHPFAKTSEIGR